MRQNDADKEQQRKRLARQADIAVGVVYLVMLVVSLMRLDLGVASVFWGAFVPGVIGLCSSYVIKWMFLRKRRRFPRLLLSIGFALFNLWLLWVEPRGIDTIAWRMWIAKAAATFTLVGLLTVPWGDPIKVEKQGSGSRPK